MNTFDKTSWFQQARQLSARVNYQRLARALALSVACIIAVVIAFIAFEGTIKAKPTPVQQAQAAQTPLLGERALFPEGWEPMGCATSGGRYSNTRCAWICGNGDGEYRVCVPVFVPNEGGE